MCLPKIDIYFIKLNIIYSLDKHLNLVFLIFVYYFDKFYPEKYY